LPAVVIIGLVLGRIGETDCEELGGGFLVQPINALTSFAYVVVGLAIAVVASRRASRPVDSYVYAACVAAVGLGSVAFHGPQPDGSRVMHDLPILITVILIALWDLRVLVPSFRAVLPTFAVAAVLATLLSIASVDAGAVATGLMLACVAVEELLIFRRGLRSGGDASHRYAAWTIIGVAVVAGASWLLGRTDSPLCDPEGVVQFHGLWHLLSSVMFGLWWWLAMTKRAPAQAGSAEPRPVDADR
jgi:hypothetical protein